GWVLWSDAGLGVRAGGARAARASLERGGGGDERRDWLMPEPALLVVMGVSGSGKSTVGALLAERLGVPFADADAFHPQANIAKMASGHPLTDVDRQPWLDAIDAWLHDRTAAGRGGGVTCSALKRPYRDRLRTRRPAVPFPTL